MFWPLRRGIFREDEGFGILVNGVDRTFRDVELEAYDAARVLKQRHPEDMVEVRVRATGERIRMLEDRRLG